MNDPISSDTIAAVATAAGGGIGIVRLSGLESINIAANLVLPWPQPLVSHRLWRGRAAGDEVLCVVMKAPSSYTGEDVVEIHGHGGALSLRQLLQAVLKLGARLAEPGEFTRRAFLAGKMDLSRAEALADVISARSERALRAAQGNLSGALANEVTAIRHALVEMRAEIEARVDFPEEHLDFVPESVLTRQLDEQQTRVARLSETWRSGRLLHRGLSVALTGRPNVGKSSLLNALVGQERAVVTENPGTTRDYLEVPTEWEGIAVTLIDTAGERPASDPAERRSIELAHERVGRADVVVQVLDAAAPERLPGRRDVMVLNKIDLATGSSALEMRGERVVPTCALDGRGLDQLRRVVLDVAGGQEMESAPPIVISTERQYQAIEQARTSLGRAAEGLTARIPPELIAADLRAAVDSLDQVTGERAGDQVLDEVFARFCIGK